VKASIHHAIVEFCGRFNARLADTARMDRIQLTRRTCPTSGRIATPILTKTTDSRVMGLIAMSSPNRRSPHLVLASTHSPTPRKHRARHNSGPHNAFSTQGQPEEACQPSSGLNARHRAAPDVQKRPLDPSMRL
jgi:hypothetical protein